MTANPFAALLDGVPLYTTFFGDMTQLDRKELTDFHRQNVEFLVSETDVIAALAAAVPADLAEAGEIAEQLLREADGFSVRASDTITALLARIAAQEAQIKGMTKERDELATANHRQASCIHVTAANLGPDCSATVDGLPKAARHVAAERDALLGAVKGLVEVLDQHETKGPLPDTALMFCWLAAQNVRAVLRGYMLEKPE